MASDSRFGPGHSLSELPYTSEIAAFGKEDYETNFVLRTKI